MVTNLPLVDAQGLWLILGCIVAAAAALGAWVARLEAAYITARQPASVAGRQESATEMPSAA
jgi:hypothetical protein